MSLPSEMYGDFYRKKINQIKAQNASMGAPGQFTYKPLPIDDLISRVPRGSLDTPVGNTVAPQKSPSFDREQLLRASQAPITEGDRKDAAIREADARGDFWGATGMRIEKGFTDTVNQPVIQGLLDLLSTGGYATANVANEMTKSAERGEGPLSYIGDIFQGVGKGVSAGLGNKDDATTWADVINRVDYNLTDRMKNGDTGESDQELVDKNMGEQTAGKAAFGLAGDILLDPLTYVGIGAIKAVGGGIKGASDFAVNSKLAKSATAGSSVTQSADEIAKTVRGLETDEFKAFVKENGNLGKIKPTARREEMNRLITDYTAANPGKSPYSPAASRAEAFKGGYKQSVDNYRDKLITDRNIRKVRKEARRLLKGKSPEVAKTIEFVQTNLDGLKVGQAQELISDAYKAEGVGLVQAEARAADDYKEIVKATETPDSPNGSSITFDEFLSTPSRNVELRAPDGTTFTKIANPITGKFVRANAAGLAKLNQQKAIAQYATEMRAQGLHLNTIKANIRKKYPDTKLYSIGADGDLVFRNPQGVEEIEGQGTLFDDLLGPVDSPETPAQTALDASPAASETVPEQVAVPETPTIKETESVSPALPEPVAELAEETLKLDKAVDSAIEEIPEFNEIRLHNSTKLSQAEQVYIRLADVSVPTGAHQYEQSVADSVKELIETRKAERNAALEANKAIAKHNAKVARAQKVSGSVKDAPKLKVERLTSEGSGIKDDGFGLFEIDIRNAPATKAEFDSNRDYLKLIGPNTDFTSLALWEDLGRLYDGLELFHIEGLGSIAKGAQLRQFQKLYESIFSIIEDKANLREGAEGALAELGKAQHGGHVTKGAVETIVKELGIDLTDSSAVIGNLFTKGPVEGLKPADNVGLAINDKYAQPYLMSVLEKYQKTLDSVPEEVLKEKALKPVPEMVTTEEIVSLGVREEDLMLALKGELPVGKGIKQSSSLRHISSAIRNGRADDDLVNDLSEIFQWDGTGDLNKFVAGKIKELDKNPLYKDIKDRFRFLGFTSDTKGTQTARDRGGAGSLAILANGGSLNDAIPLFKPATLEEGQAFYTQRYDRAQLNIASIGDEQIANALFAKSDEFLKKMGVYQSTPAGPKTSKSGASVSEAEDTAKRIEQFNSHAQINMASNVISYIRRGKEFGALLDARGLKGKARMNLQIAATRNMMIMLESKARLLGADIHAKNFHPRGANNLTVRLSVGDIMDIMPNEFIRKTMFGHPSYFKPTEVLDIVELAIRSATRIDVNGSVDIDAVKAAVISGSTGKIGDGSKHFGGERISQANDIERQINTLQRAMVQAGGEFKDAWWASDKAIKEGKLKNFYDDRVAFLNNMLNGGKPGSSKAANVLEDYANVHLAKLVDDILKPADDGVSFLAKFVERNITNASAMNARLIDEAHKIGKEFFDKVAKADTMGRKAIALATKPEVKLAPDAQRMVDSAVESVRLENGLNPAEAAFLERTNKRAQGAVKNRIIAEPSVAAKAAAEDAESLIEAKTLEMKNIEEADMHPAAKQEELLSLTEDLQDTLYVSHTKGMIGKIAPVRSFFDSALGSDTWRQLNQTSHVGAHLMNGFHSVINKWNKVGLHGDRLTAAIKGIQSKAADGLETAHKSSLTEDEAQVSRLMSILFDESHNNFFTRNGIGAHLFNEKLDKVFGKVGASRYKIPDPDNFTQADWAKVWTEWDIEDGGKFLEAFFHGFLELSNDLTIGGHFSKFGRRTPPVGEDWVRITQAEKSDMYFMKLIDRDLYYPREVAQEIPFIEELMQANRTVDNNFVKRVFDPVTSMLKGWQTTAKPGHHMMSIIGDLWRNSIMGMGGSGKEYKEALSILRTQGHITFRMGDNDPLDEFNQIFEMAMGGATTKSDKAMTFTVSAGKGKVKQVKVSNKDLYDEMKRQGMIPPPHLGGGAEDFLTDYSDVDALKTDNKLYKGVAKVTTMMDKPLNNSKWSLNRFAANRDAVMRAAPYLHELKKNMVKYNGDLARSSQEAANHVKKWAPLANDLGAGESKYLRRMIYFYTWLRGVTPRIIEFAATRPGMATLPAKLNYNMALAGGIQNESFGVPFPDEDKPVFASWYKEGVLGPQWMNNMGDLMGINPTHPVLDVLNSLGSGITPNNLNPLNIDADQSAGAKLGNTLLGMTNPLLRAPVEIAGGKRVDTGAPIESTPQYLLDYFMPAKEISRATGVSLEPGLPRRTESKYAEGARTDEEIARDLNMQAINFFTGAGLTNYSSGQKSAEFQERDRLKKEKDLEERYR